MVEDKDSKEDVGGGNGEGEGEGGGEGAEHPVPDYSDVVTRDAIDFSRSREELKPSQRRIAEGTEKEEQSGRETENGEHLDSRTVRDFSDTTVKRSDEPSQRRIAEGKQEEGPIEKDKE